MKIAGKRGLRDAHALLRKAAAQVLLIGNALGGNQPQDLAVAECFSSAHPSLIYIRLYIYTFAGEGCQINFRFLRAAANCALRRHARDWAMMKRLHALAHPLAGVLEPLAGFSILPSSQSCPRNARQKSRANNIACARG